MAPEGDLGIPNQLCRERHCSEQEVGDAVINHRNIGCGNKSAGINETVFAEGKAWNVPRAVREPGELWTQPGVNWYSLEL